MDSANLRKGDRVIPTPEVLEKVSQAVTDFYKQNGYIIVFEVNIIRQNRVFYFRTLCESVSGRQKSNVSKYSVPIDQFPFKLYQQKLHELKSQDREDVMLVYLSDEEYDNRFSLKSLWGDDLQKILRETVSRTQAVPEDVITTPTTTSTMTFTYNPGMNRNRTYIDWANATVSVGGLGDIPVRIVHEPIPLDNMEVELHLEDEEQNQNP